jgi:hypothetical protein
MPAHPSNLGTGYRGPGTGKEHKTRRKLTDHDGPDEISLARPGCHLYRCEVFTVPGPRSPVPVLQGVSVPGPRSPVPVLQGVSVPGPRSPVPVLIEAAA